MNGSGTIEQTIMKAEGGRKGTSSTLASAKMNITGSDDSSKAAFYFTFYQFNGTFASRFKHKVFLIFPVTDTV